MGLFITPLRVFADLSLPVATGRPPYPASELRWLRCACENYRAPDFFPSAFDEVAVPSDAI